MTKRMTRLIRKEIIIVGCSHYTKGEEITAFLERNLKEAIILIPEPDNKYDNNAVTAMVNGCVIGYVRKEDVKRNNLFNTISNSTYGRVVAMPKSYDLKFGSITAGVELSEVCMEDDGVEKSQREWQYTSVVLQPPTVMSNLDSELKNMLLLLENNMANEAAMRYYLDKYKELAIFAFSKETIEMRKKLYDLLSLSDHPELKAMAVELSEISTMIHDGKNRYDAFNTIKKELKKQFQKEYKDSIDSFDPVMIKRQLEAFPAGLYKKRTEAMEFPTNIYYARMPNVVLMKFLSAMTIVICVESQNKKEAKVRKKKRGRPRLSAGDHNFRSRIIGNKMYKELWIKQIGEMLEGKNGADAGLEMAALVSMGVAHSAPYAFVKETFGVKGDPHDYNKAMKYDYQLKNKPAFDNVCRTITQYSEQIKAQAKQQTSGNQE